MTKAPDTGMHAQARLNETASQFVLLSYIMLPEISSAVPGADDRSLHRITTFRFYFTKYSAYLLFCFYSGVYALKIEFPLSHFGRFRSALYQQSTINVLKKPQRGFKAE
ncbi:hypothetical protein AVEN_218796-1 [Araneus ventricosus]|uniref:Uncharacterized protein n=1 Tax=Araneus ventricosus TaxID=182803 RepID=A0A4Y2B6M9_ARAVE|nr:hypothetical protein AVEN_218796-1 [Araneus ventricosus]